MTAYQIAGKQVEFDGSMPYMDFSRRDGKVYSINIGQLLDQLQSGQLAVDNGLKGFMVYLQTWKTEAPRKRCLREMRAEGYAVLTAEQLFDGDGGEEILVGLENTGEFADYFLKQVYG